MKVVIKSKNQIQNAETLPVSDMEKRVTVAPKAKVPIKSSSQWQPSNINIPRPKSQRISEGNRGSVAYSARAPLQKSQTTHPTPKKSQSSTNSARLASTKPLSRLLSGRQIAGKNIETLKTQKLEIFQKMSSTHERIIELLDKIKTALLEVYVPISTQEKNKRQKNALEFSVRFSRNFLYPLKGMVEDIRVTSPDALNSATSNDATVRVSSIFNLLFQALSTYNKQLRFFLHNQKPQKLNTVLEMINTVTKYCLSKGFFDRNDTIVECMLERSNKFLEFLADFQHKPEKQQVAAVRVTNPSRVSNKNYELKMCMNDLNMYEPKLVPKRKPRKIFSKKPVEVKPVEEPVKPVVVSPQPKKLSSVRKSQELMKLNLENVDTQMMDVQQSEVEWDSPKKSKAQKMVQKLTKDLKNSTRSQVAEVLGPLLKNLGVRSDLQVGFPFA